MATRISITDWRLADPLRPFGPVSRIWPRCSMCMEDDDVGAGRCACCSYFNGSHFSSCWQDTRGECLIGALSPTGGLTAEHTCDRFKLDDSLPDALARLHAEGYPERPGWWCYL